MPLSATVQIHQGRPQLHLNGRPTAEFWCYGAANAIDDFAAGGVRICQFHAPFPSWWIGPGEYNFGPVEEKLDALLEKQPELLLNPRVNFGYEGEAWWAEAHPDQLSVGRNLDDEEIDYREARVRPIDCWQSAASQQWTQDAAGAMRDFVQHFEQRNGEQIIGYQVGGGISAEWFRWWTFVEETYEDYSAVAAAAFREFLKQRYADDAALQQAWGRTDVTRETAAVPSPRQLHTPARGFFRDPVTERNVLDWLFCLSELHTDQLIAVCQAVKDATSGQKLAGVFYGYLWPHWNTQNPARSGHLLCRKVFGAAPIDYISAPYQYDNRREFHHSQSLPATVERCGKLFLAEIDTPTHLTQSPQFPTELLGKPKTADEAARLLLRDAATVLGTGGTGWWMDLRESAWYADPQLHQVLADVHGLTQQAVNWSLESQAEVALVIDDASYAYADLRDNLNLYFTSLPRQFEWSDLGFPWDTVLLSELADVKRYKLYVFLNCWHVDAATRAEIFGRTRHSGGAAIYFYGAGYYDGERADAAAISDLVGMQVNEQPDAAIPEIQLAESGHPLVEQSLVTPRGAMRFGARLAPERCQRLVRDNPRGWEHPVTPIFEVTDLSATVLGNYIHDNAPGCAVLERDGWASVYCGAPLLPAWLLRRVAEGAGVHCYAPLGTVVHHRGPLLSCFRVRGGDVNIVSPVGHRLTPIEPQGERRAWRPVANKATADDLEVRFAPLETKFFITNR